MSSTIASALAAGGSVGVCGVCGVRGAQYQINKNPI